MAKEKILDIIKSSKTIDSAYDIKLNKGQETNAASATRKDYVDSEIAKQVSKSGDTIAHLTINNNGYFKQNYGLESGYKISKALSSITDTKAGLIVLGQIITTNQNPEGFAGTISIQRGSSSTNIITTIVDLVAKKAYNLMDARIVSTTSPRVGGGRLCKITHEGKDYIAYYSPSASARSVVIDGISWGIEPFVIPDATGYVLSDLISSTDTTRTDTNDYMLNNNSNERVPSWGVSEGQGFVMHGKTAIGGANDGWLRLNPFDAFTTGIYTGNGIIRHGGTSIQLGSLGDVQATTLYRPNDVAWGLSTGGYAAVSVKQQSSSSAHWLLGSYKTSAEGDMRAGIQVLSNDAAHMRLYTNMRTHYAEIRDGNILVSGAQSAAGSSLTRKDYVDGQDALKLNKTGDTMTGNLSTPKVLLTTAQGAEANSVTRRDFVEATVTAAGSGKKDLTIALPSGAPATGYIPVSFNFGSANNSEIYINTRTDVGAAPMNNCSFNGIVRASGWSDASTYSTGFFTIHDLTERSLHSFQSCTENATNFIVAYVETRAFPINVRVDVGVAVTASATDVTFGTSVFKVNGQDGGNTKTAVIANFDKGLGYYNRSNRVYDTGYNPTPDDVGAVNKAGDTMTGQLTISQASANPGLILERTNLAYNVSMLFKTTTLSNYLGMDRNGKLRYGSAIDIDATGAFVYTSDNKPTPADLGAVAKSGDSMIGQLNLTPSFVDTSNNAQLAHNGKDATKPLYIRNMREHSSSSWLWEKVYDGSLYYSSGTNGSGTNKIRLLVSGTGSGEIYLGTNADKRVYHEGFKPTVGDVGAAPSGYGLGVNAPLIHDRSGFFANASSGVAGYPGNGAGFQSTYSSNRRAQIYMNSSGAVYSRFSLDSNVIDTSTPWAIHYTTLNKPTSADIGAVDKAGDVMTGDLTVPAVLVSSAQNTSINALTRKDYVDAAIDTKASNRVNFATGLGIARAITGATLPTHAGVWGVNNSTWTPHTYGSLYVTTNRADELTTTGAGSFIHYLFISHNSSMIYTATNVNGIWSGWRPYLSSIGDQELAGNLTIKTNAPILTLHESDTGKKWLLVADGYGCRFQMDNTGGLNAWAVDSAGTVNICDPRSTTAQGGAAGSLTRKDYVDGQVAALLARIVALESK